MSLTLTASRALALHGLEPELFLREYWQRKPLLLRGAICPMPELLTPDELAGLATEEGVDSRIVIEKGGSSPWELRRGPFPEEEFSTLPKSHWTLLVNGVDRWIPAVNALFDSFSFLPSWRFDDIMVSYAVEGGNVGAHVDNFDVFLIQAQGRREWQIGESPILEDDFVPGLPIKLLREFKPDQRWILEPGDLLYLPPRFPHHGIGLGDDCMTISVGFRAPTVAELYDSYATQVLATLPESVRFTDPGRAIQHPGEISLAEVRRFRSLIESGRLDDSQFARWLGGFFSGTECAPAEEGEYEFPDLAALPPESLICRAEGSRFYFSDLPDGVVMFCDGEDHNLGVGAEHRVFAEVPSGSVRNIWSDLSHAIKSPEHHELIESLFQRGKLYVEE